MLTPPPLPPPPGGPPPPLPPPPLPPPPGERDAQGRFLPGRGGRRPGAKNRATVLLESLFEGGVLEIGQAVLLAVRRGDMMAARIALDRASPVRRGRPIEIPDFPELQSVHDVPRAMSRLASAVAGGEITPEEAGAVAGVLEKFVAAVEAVDLAARLEAIEKAQEESRATR